jgi:peptide/nickel transport system substrate-binding protein
MGRFDGTWSRRDVLRTAAFGAAAVAGGVALDACSSSTGGSTATTSNLKPQKGGTLRIGMTGGTASDTLDADNAISDPDNMRTFSLYSPLFYYDANLNIANGVAEDITSDATSQVWTIPLRQGVLFSNGKEMTADDVVFTFQRILNPKNNEQGLYSGLGPIVPSSVTALDKYTVRLKTNVPYASLPQQIASYHTLVVPVGYDVTKPIGSGPFMLESFSPDATTVLKRNPNYYQSGLPYLDEVVITEYADFTSQVNALLSNSVDIIGAIPPSSVPSLRSESGITILAYTTGQWNPFTMRMDKPPFDNVKVRQAMRLIVDRTNIIDSAYDGEAILGNDVSAQFDPGFEPFPQRMQDIPQAKSLLSSAGYSDLKVQLVVLPDIPGTVESAEVLQQNAASAGVTISFVTPDATTFDSKYYGNSLLSQDSWPYFSYLSQAAQAFLPTSPYNATHFSDPQYTSYNQQANSTTSASLRAELMHEMQQIEYERGTYIIPTFNKVIDVFRNNVHGVTGWKTGFPINSCQFQEIWMS